MKSPFTTTLDQSLIQFLSQEAKREKVKRNVIIEEALNLYKNIKLEMAVREGLKERQDEYREISHDFLAAQKFVLKRYEEN